MSKSATWTWGHDGHGGLWIEADGEQIGYVSHGREDRARLIAAAPELLNALQVVVAHYCNLVRCGDAGKWEPDAESEIQQARAAIAKATGAA